MAEVSVEVVAKVENRLGESVLWHAATRTVQWIDLMRPEISSLDEAGSVRTRPLPLPTPLGAIVATSDPGKLVLGWRGGLSVLDMATLALAPLIDPERGRDGVAFNDCKVDRAGRLWAGSSHEREIETRGCLWCVDAAGSCTLADAGFAVANGPAFSPDGRVMYFSDSNAHRILAYDIAADGRASGRRLFAAFDAADGMPDGLTVDAEGCPWVAHWAGAKVSRWSPKGERLASIPVPSVHVTAVAFGGPRLDTLYIVTAREGADAASLARLPLSGHAFACRPGVTGIVEPLFPLRG